MPYRKRKPKSKQARQQRKFRGKVSSSPRQIQNATYMPKSRLVRFSGFRSFIVRDEGFNTTGALPPVLEIGANNPRKFIHTTQGTWDSNSLGAKGVAVAGLSQWLTNKVPSASATASYLNGQALSCRVDITAVPLPMAGTEDTYQDTIKMCVQNNTRGGNMINHTITQGFNSEIISQTVGMRTAMMYTNPGGTPRGASITLKYSFKQQNAGITSQHGNFFYLDTDPLEKDMINLAFLPGDSTKYGLSTLGGIRLPDMRVEVKISYIVLLSEPNTAIDASELNSGVDLPIIPTGLSVSDLIKQM
ncbi:MAG TPA: hypothetical protein EYN67_17705 [Flavobacteriales bacterium]|nr:hypothetical protein [Flavobacteriales bacterium]